MSLNTNILREFAEHTSKLFDVVRIDGDETKTTFTAQDQNKTYILEGSFKKQIPEFEGSFGIPNLAIFAGLLKFPSYMTPEATLTATRQLKPKMTAETVTEFKFKDKNKKGASFKTMASSVLAEKGLGSSAVPNITWDITFKPEKSKVNEFADLARLYNEVDKKFTISNSDDDLIFAIGSDSDSTHNVDMMFVKDVQGRLKTPLDFSTQKFLEIIRVLGNLDIEITISSRRLLSLKAESENISYRYFLRGEV